MNVIPAGLHPNLRTLVDACAARFEAEFGRRAEVVAAAPGRVNLIGEHTDYNGGFVLPMAIDRWCVAAGARADGSRGRVFSVPLGERAEYDAGARDGAALPLWARYSVGAIWKAAEALGCPGAGAVDAVLDSTVPLGGGLSSSAAVELASAGLMSGLGGFGLSAEQLMRAAHAAEHEFAGVPCGVMDQTVCAFAEAGRAMLIDCRSMERRAVALPDPDRAVIVVADSGVRHALASGGYAARRAACERASRILGVELLRDVDLRMLVERTGELDHSDWLCAKHVVMENARVQEFAVALEVGDLHRAGRMMSASHQSLRSAYRVSCDELDAMVDAACAVPGVLGSRMTGGGFGGCTVTLCAPGAVHGLAAVLNEVTAPHALRPFVVTPVGGVRAWRV